MERQPNNGAKLLKHSPRICACRWTMHRLPKRRTQQIVCPFLVIPLQASPGQHYCIISVSSFLPVCFFSFIYLLFRANSNNIHIVVGRIGRRWTGIAPRNINFIEVMFWSSSRCFAEVVNEIRACWIIKKCYERDIIYVYVWAMSHRLVFVAHLFIHLDWQKASAG